MDRPMSMFLLITLTILLALGAILLGKTQKLLYKKNTNSTKH